MSEAAAIGFAAVKSKRGGRKKRQRSVDAVGDLEVR